MSAVTKNSTFAPIRGVFKICEVNPMKQDLSQRVATDE
jgi:hypothetical protein